MPRPNVAVVAAAFVAGIAATLHGLAPWLAAAALAGVAAAPARVRSAAIACAIACSLGIAVALARPAPEPPRPDARTRAFDATVVAMRVGEGGRTEAELRLADGRGASASLRARDVPIGARLRLRGRAEPFDGPRNPGEPGERAFAAERGLDVRIAHARIVAALPPDARDPAGWLARLRARASARVHAMLPEPDATILAGALWGERGGLPPALRAEFQDTGTVHVLVTAGLHLGVVAWLALALLRGLRAGRVAAALGAIAIVWAYAAFSGGHLPSLRAATMVTFALLAHALGRDARSWNALGAAAIVVALLRPASVGTLSFALSFSCVAAILAFTDPFAALARRCGAPGFACEPLGVVAATQLGTWPLTAFAFLVIAPYAPLANALVVPVVGVAMLGGIAMLAASPLPIPATLAANVETSLLDWIVGVVRLASALPHAHVIATPPPVWTIVAYDCALAAAAVLVRRERVRLAAAIACAACALCLWPPRAPSRDLVVTAIDVGQADSLLIRTPSGRALLVDGGGRLERGPQSGTSSAQAVGERVVVPFLVREGVHRLDALLISHPHGDHVGGAAPVLRTLGADAFADSDQRYGGFAYTDALAAARERGVPMREPHAGDVWHTDDGVTLRFYGPALPHVAGTRNDVNENSLVFRLEYRGFRMLFTGDAGAVTEARLLASGFDLRADVLKVGHHGSAYGTTPAFVRAVSPRWAVISVGRDNLFGHPAPSTVVTLEAAGATVMRTDRDGAVRIRTDGARIDVVRTIVPATTDDGIRRYAVGRSPTR